MAPLVSPQRRDLQEIIDEMDTWNDWVTQSVTTLTTGSTTSIYNHNLITWAQWNNNTTTNATSYYQMQIINQAVQQAWTLQQWPRVGYEQHRALAQQVGLDQQNALARGYNLASVQPGPPRKLPQEVGKTKEQKDKEAYSRWSSEFWFMIDSILAEAAKVLAKQKARKLLIEYLSAAQKETYEKHSYFIVEVDGVQYRIDQGSTGNVRELDKNGKPVSKYCIHPYERVPEEDTMLAQKLMLETDLPRFKRIANRSDFRN